MGKEDGPLPALSYCIATRNLSGALCEEGRASSAAQLGGKNEDDLQVHYTTRSGVVKGYFRVVLFSG
jgi:hypothetical protein